MSKKLIVIPILTLLCLVFVASSVQADLDLSNGYATGQWWNPERDGEGFYVEVIGEGENLQIGLAMFSYDEAGNQLWLVGNVPIAQGDIVATVPVLLVEGPVWGTGYDPADKNTTEFGSIVVRFPTCDTALFNVQSNVQTLESGNYSLVRITEIVGMDCTDPPPEPEGGITPGLWTGIGVCFFVNPEGNLIIESESCFSTALKFEAGGTLYDLDGPVFPTVDCGVSVECDGTWPITGQRLNCVNNAGGVVNVYFTSATEASVHALEGVGNDGTVCVSTGATASPSPSQ
jgi:hypothetical protein